jgi:hypothetical protein
VHPHGPEREYLLELLAAYFEVKRDVDPALVEHEGCNAFVSEMDEACMAADPEAHVLGGHA